MNTLPQLNRNQIVVVILVLLAVAATCYLLPSACQPTPPPGDPVTRTPTATLTPQPPTQTPTPTATKVPPTWTPTPSPMPPTWTPTPPPILPPSGGDTCPTCR